MSRTIDTPPFPSWPGGTVPDRAGLSVEPRPLATEADVWAAITSVPDGRGWIARPHRVEEWPGGTPEGLVLSAEIAGSAGVSLHVRRTGRTWTGWTYREVPGDDLVFRERFVGTVEGHPERRLVYATHWRLSDPDDTGVRVYRPYAARFTGWET